MNSRNIRRTAVRAALVATGIAAAVTLAGCAGAQTASGSASASGGVSTGAPATTPVPVTTSSSDTGATQGGGTPATTDASNTGGSANTARTSSECKASELKLSFGGGDAGMSQQHRVLRFTNSGSRTCTMIGWPGVSYVTGDSGTQVGQPAQRTGAKGKTVTLAPGAVASTTIDAVDVGVFDPNACKQTAVRGYRVYAPDDTASMFISLGSGAMGCAGTTPSPQLSVVTITAGPGA